MHVIHIIHRSLLSAGVKMSKKKRAQASPQGAAICSSHKQAGDSGIICQNIHHKVRKQLGNTQCCFSTYEDVDVPKEIKKNLQTLQHLSPDQRCQRHHL